MTKQEALLDWYDKYHRKLPWRETSEGYAIWLSEIMCQQTQVVTVIDYYNRFLETYPTIFQLAEAREDDVYKLWEGLGYYSRARRLMECAREVVKLYKGVFPKTYGEMIKLPGIGPYTAGALLSIIYNIKEPAIDGNVMRVYARLYKIENDIGKPDARKYFDSYVRRDLPEDVRHFNQALMELGATICTPKNPKCESCPLKEECVAYEEDLQLRLPFKAPKPKKQTKNMTVAYVVFDDEVLLEKRDTQGLLANLWGFPILEAEADSDGLVEAWLQDEYGLVVRKEEVMIRKKHVFTHLVWHMTLIRYRAEVRIEIEEPEIVWIKPSKISDYPLPTAFLKLL